MSAREILQCPHCHGDLRKAPSYVDYQYECKRCGRGWIVLDDKYWLALFDAGSHIYEIDKHGEVIDRNSVKDDELREKLWERVRKK